MFFGLLKDCSELVDGAEDGEETVVYRFAISMDIHYSKKMELFIHFRYRVMLTSVVDAMKKYIQIAKPKSRRYFIQDTILKPLFLKVRFFQKL